MTDKRAIPCCGSLSLRLSVTGRCRMRCLYCRPPVLAGAEHRSQSAEEISPAEAARFVRAVRAGFGLRSVRITGGEPLLREDIAKIIEAMAAEGVADIALTTNGQMLFEKAAALKSAGLRRVNISLDSLNEDVYRTITGGELGPTLDGIDAAVSNSLLPVKLNCVVLRGINDRETPEIVRFGAESGCHVRFLELMPIGPARAKHESLFVSSDETIRMLKEDFDLFPLPRENGTTSRDFLARDGRGRATKIGFISPQSHPFCAECRRIRLTSEGKLIGCLASGAALDIRKLLRDWREGSNATILEMVSLAMGFKPRIESYENSLLMVRVGG